MRDAEEIDLVIVRATAGTGGAPFPEASLRAVGVGRTDDANDDEVVPVAVVDEEDRDDFLDMMLRATGGVVDIFKVGLFSSE